MVATAAVALPKELLEILVLGRHNSSTIIIKTIMVDLATNETDEEALEFLLALTIISPSLK